MPGSFVVNKGVTDVIYSIFLEGKEYLVNSSLEKRGLTNKVAFNSSNKMVELGATPRY